MNTAFTLDDILLVPTYSTLEREDIDISSYFCGLKLDIPILSAPMDTVTGLSMIKAMKKNGALGVHHRYCSNADLLSVAPKCDILAVSPSMGIEFIDSLLLFNPNLILMLDVAHGHTKRNLDFCEKMLARNVRVVSGNIATVDAAKDYLSIGISALRVGIGNGSICTTRQVTGCGYPQGSALMEISDYVGDRVYIISDGGIKTYGDIVKALALGADLVMSGRLFAGTKESIGDTNYRGMASREALVDAGKFKGIPEGISTTIESKGSVSEVLFEMASAIRLACYYLGAKSIYELKEAKRVLITQNAYVEGLAR